MKLEIKNLAKIKQAHIEIDGITVVAGENNTGKSTIAKAIYVFFDSFYDIENKIATHRENFLIRNVLNFIINEDKPPVLPKQRLLFSEITDLIIENKLEVNLLVNKIMQKFTIGEEKRSLLQSIFDTAAKYDDLTLASSIIDSNFNTVFYKQINNVNSKESPEFNMTVANKQYTFTFGANNKISTNTIFYNNSDVVYIDNPFVIDDLYDSSTRNRQDRPINYKEKLLQQFVAQPPESDNIIFRLETEQKLQDIMSKINTAANGEFANDSNSKIVFAEKGMAEPISIINLSAGLKTFLILKKLLLSSVIQDKSVIILDEPEIHLHPKWQLLLAEILVLLQKTFNLHILLTTHSPYFLNAIEIYSAQNCISDRCRYYLSDLQENFATFKDVTTQTDLIYTLLAKPFQELHTLQYQMDKQEHIK